MKVAVGVEAVDWMIQSERRKEGRRTMRVAVVGPMTILSLEWQLWRKSMMMQMMRWLEHSVD